MIPRSTASVVSLAAFYERAWPVAPPIRTPPTMTCERSAHGTGKTSRKYSPASRQSKGLSKGLRLTVGK